MLQKQPFLLPIRVDEQLVLQGEALPFQDLALSLSDFFQHALMGAGLRCGH